MTYFTSWDVNVFLCLISLGLPGDLVGEWTRKFKKIHRELVLEEARDYYLDRKEGLPKTGSEKVRKLLRDRQSEWAYGYGREINMKAISPIRSIPNQFWLQIQKVHHEYEQKLKDIEPEDRYEYFEWAYINHYYFWNYEIMEWVRKFHPGRFYLMDCKRIKEYEIDTMENIRDLEDIGAMFEERFIRKQDHIEDLLNEKSLYSY